jgi:alpha-L-fucosidase
MRLLILLYLFTTSVQAQVIDQNESVLYKNKMAWFKDAKLGIFIHWGLYSVKGINESWSFFNGEISHEEYLKQTEGFTAKDYDPNYWARLIKQSGAKYSVITSKHHDGFALWDTQYGDLNAVNSAAKKDVLSPFIKALRNNNLKVGIYYSLPDWSYNDYTHFTREENRYSIIDDPKRWQTFKKYSQNQLAELRNKYNPDLWWFDGDWEHSADEWEVKKIKSFLSEKNPKVIFNSRLQGNGDYETPEIGVPVQRPKAEYWELCMTMNDNWGYQPKDSHYKSPQQVIDVFVDCISKGGNLLLDIGPKADGTIPLEQEIILKELGKWTARNSEAIYKTRKGIPYDFYYGPTTLSKDKTILYLFVRDIPKDGQVSVKGISNKIKNIRIVGVADSDLTQEIFCKVSWNTYPGITYVTIPESNIDTYYTVLALELDDTIKLYGEQPGAIESN